MTSRLATARRPRSWTLGRGDHHVEQSGLTPTEYDERVLTSGLPPLHDRRGTARVVWDLVAGLGPLQRYLDDPLVEEICVNERLTQG